MLRLITVNEFEGLRKNSGLNFCIQEVNYLTVQATPGIAGYFFYKYVLGFLDVYPRKKNQM